MPRHQITQVKELGSAMAFEPRDAAQHHEAVALETGHLRSAQITALALASQTPAVALATVPFLIVLTAGHGSWLGALIIALTTACIGFSVITFSRRYVGTGSVYSYMPHVFGAWGRLLVGATLAIGFVTLIAGVSATHGHFRQQLPGRDRPQLRALRGDDRSHEHIRNRHSGSAGLPGARRVDSHSRRTDSHDRPDRYADHPCRRIAHGS